MTYTKEQIDRANQTDLVSFLQAQGEQLERAGQEYRWKRHDSRRKGDQPRDPLLGAGRLYDYDQRFRRLLRLVCRGRRRGRIRVARFLVHLRRVRARGGRGFRRGFQIQAQPCRNGGRETLMTDGPAAGRTLPPDFFIRAGAF